MTVTDDGVPICDRCGNSLEFCEGGCADSDEPLNRVALAAPAPTPEAKIKRDQWGRYVIPHPETGKTQSWTRATTLAGTLADHFGLEQWAKRNVVLGLGARQDLYAQAASCTPDDKDQLSQIVKQAEEAAKSSAGANLGTALHRFVERINAGEDVTAPPPWDADLDAYKVTMASHGVTIVDGWTERVLLVPGLGVAGTCDALCQSTAWQRPRIGDLKTGKDVAHYGMTEIALQLAIYAHATYTYDPATNKTAPLDQDIDWERAIVMHLPVAQGHCTLYEVDIHAGWEAVQLAVDVREWRKRKDLAEQMVPGVDPHAAEMFAQRLEWLAGRVDLIKQAGNEAKTMLALLWSSHRDIPTFPNGGPHNHAEIDVIETLCDRVETAHELAFGPSDPTKPTPINIKSTRKTTA